MILTILGSESAGNCYLLKSASECLILESGVRLQILKQALDYDLSKVVGCMVSHFHGDHWKYHSDYAKAGIDLHANEECWRHSTYTGHRANTIKEDKLYRIGDFRIVPFLVPHGGVKCHGFFIKHPDMGSMVFITDAASVPVKFNAVNHICIEANYSEQTMVSDRAIGHHMSLESAMHFLKNTDLSKCYNVILLHLSAKSSDAKLFFTTIQKIAPNATVTVADKGIELTLSSHPF